MNQGNILFVISIAILVALGGIGLNAYLADEGGKMPETVKKVSEEGGKEPDAEAIGAEEEGGSLPAAHTDIAPSMSVPDLDRPITVTETLTPEAEEYIAADIRNTAGALKENPDFFSGWLDLGLFRKIIGDHEGARQAWEYAGAIRPQNSLSFGNLGILYGYYLGDPARAEGNFLRAVENDPKIVNLYHQMADFYLEVLDDREKAVAIVKRGIKENPEETSLIALLESLSQ